MDEKTVTRIREEGLTLDLDRLTPRVLVHLDERGEEVVPPGECVGLIDENENVGKVSLKSIPELFSGTNRACVIGQEVPEEYEPLIATVECAAVDYCVTVDRKPADDHFKEIFQYLIRLPDGDHSDPLVSYYQAGFRLYMSVREVSRNEYRSVLERLQKSIRNFRLGNDSTNYIDYVAHQFNLAPDPTEEMLEKALKHGRG